MKKTLIITLAAAVALCVFAGAAAGALGGNSLTIDITTHPAGATVTYPGMGSITTPDSFTVHSSTATWGIPTTLTVYKSGYKTEYIYITEADFNKASEGSYTISKDITLQANEGTLSLSSSPSGASVRVDGVNYGYTPTDVKVPAGTHTVTFSKNGYSTLSKTVSVGAGSTTGVTASLSQIISTGYLSVSSNPKYADLYVDGSYQGQTPITISLDTGSHTIQLRKSGYSTYTANVRVNEGQTSVISASLSEVVTSGYVSIASTPGGAAVYIDGKFEGNTPYSSGGSVSYLSAGPYSTNVYHTLELRLSGYNTYSTTFKTEEKSTVTITPTLTQVTPTSGSLTVSSSPSGAALYVDNVYWGITPATVTGLAAGSHSVMVTASGYTDSVNTIAVTAGQTTPLAVTLSPNTPAPTPTSKSPAPILGILAGLAAAGVFFVARRH